jgi:hypothetical protein
VTVDPGNCTMAACETPIVVTLEDEFDVFDRLPAPLRAYLNDAPVRFSAINLVEIFAEDFAGGVWAAIPAMMRNAEAIERENFNDDHRARHGCELPHVLAGVSALRGTPADSWAPSR